MIESGLLPHLQDALEKRIDRCPYVFHKQGKKIVDIKWVWSRACRETGLGFGYRLRGKYVEKWEAKGLTVGPYFHDNRRSAVRNMTRAGVDRKTAMRISGHKTESVFNRYDITDDRDLADAAKKLEKFREEKAAPASAETQNIDAMDMARLAMMYLASMASKSKTK